MADIIDKAEYRRTSKHYRESENWQRDNIKTNTYVYNMKTDKDTAQGQDKDMTQRLTKI